MFMSDAMKFGKFAHLLGALLSSGTGLSMPTPRRRSASVPTGAALRNPADPYQAERIERAAQKRERKAVVLVENTLSSVLGNLSHQVAPKLDRGLAGIPRCLNPFYVNH